MPPRKSKRKLSQLTSSPSPSSRRSSRLAGRPADAPEGPANTTEGQSTETTENQPANAPQSKSPHMSTVSGLLELSTEVDSESWPELRSRAKQRLDNHQHSDRHNEENLVPCLFSCLEWLPEGGRESLARDVLASKTDEGLWRVFHNLLTGLLYPMKATSRAPSVANSSVEKRLHNAEIVAAATGGETQSREEIFRKLCLQRDGYRCVVSHHMEPRHFKEIGRPEGVLFGRLEAAHIVPYAYGSWKGPEGAPEKVVKAWEILYRCFPGVWSAGMSVECINDPANSLALRDALHSEFGDFNMSFKATDVPHTYILKTFDFSTGNQSLLPESPEVTFAKAEGAETIPLPSPALLDCHFRIAEILHASGMGPYIDQKIREWDSIKGSPGASQLRQDGTTNIEHYLRAGLWESVSV